MKNDEIEMQGPFERKNMPPISMDVVRELNVIGKKEYDSEMVFQSYEPDATEIKQKRKKKNKIVMVSRAAPEIYGIKSDLASDGESDKVEFTKTKKENENDEKILESISLKKPLLKYHDKVLKDNIKSVHFARKLELNHIIEDHNRFKPKH